MGIRIYPPTTVRIPGRGKDVTLILRTRVAQAAIMWPSASMTGKRSPIHGKSRSARQVVTVRILRATGGVTATVRACVTSEIRRLLDHFVGS